MATEDERSGDSLVESATRSLSYVHLEKSYKATSGKYLSFSQFREVFG